MPVFLRPFYKHQSDDENNPLVAYKSATRHCVSAFTFHPIDLKIYRKSSLL